MHPPPPPPPPQSSFLVMNAGQGNDAEGGGGGVPVLLVPEPQLITIPDPLKKGMTRDGKWNHNLSKVGTATIENR